MPVNFKVFWSIVCCFIIRRINHDNTVLFKMQERAIFSITTNLSLNLVLFPYPPIVKGGMLRGSELGSGY